MDREPRVRTGGDYSLLGKESNPPKKLSKPYLGSSSKLNTLPLYFCPSRSAYCAASVASLTNVVTPDLFEGTAEWIAR